MKGDDWLGIWCICLWYYYMINSSLFLSLSLTFLSSFCAIIIMRLQTKYHPFKKNFFFLNNIRTSFPINPLNVAFLKTCISSNSFFIRHRFTHPLFHLLGDSGGYISIRGLGCCSSIVRKDRSCNPNGLFELNRLSRPSLGFGPWCCSFAWRGFDPCRFE